MSGLRRVYVAAPPEVQRREKAKLRAEQAERRYLAAARELEFALAEVEQPIGQPSRPAPRAVIAEAAIAEFCATVTGLPAIRPA